jgi:hypothetical protein
MTPIAPSVFRPFLPRKLAKILLTAALPAALNAMVPGAGAGAGSRPAPEPLPVPAAVPDAWRVPEAVAALAIQRYEPLARRFALMANLAVWEHKSIVDRFYASEGLDGDPRSEGEKVASLRDIVAMVPENYCGDRDDLKVLFGKALQSRLAQPMDERTRPEGELARVGALAWWRGEPKPT